MLTRLKVRGFKNLLDVDVRFGPFTCIAGANGVGKSNVFDAIHFLQLLTTHELVKAAQSIRDDRGRSGDVRGLFYRCGSQWLDEMVFEAEMITPHEGVDRLRQPAKATSSLLKYRLKLRYRGEDTPYGPLEILEEELAYVTKGNAPDHVRFPHSVKEWRDKLVVANRHTKTPYIYTQANSEDHSGERVILIQQDGTQGRPQPRLAEPLPATVLSSLSASEAPTAVVARNEMESWRLLQFEPTALRRADELRDAPGVGTDGSHLAATLYKLAGNGKHDGAGEVESGGSSNGSVKGAALRQRVANRISQLVSDIRDVYVDKDEKRELLTLMARLSDKTAHPARSLSDGTLRFLALAIIEVASDATGVFCLEEPENGIHPERIPAMLQLLTDIATDPEEPPDSDNPLRQVIVNTHSPTVVANVDDSDLVIAEHRQVDGAPYGLTGAVPTVRVSALAGTWRTDAGAPECAKGQLLSYLNPLDKGSISATEGKPKGKTKVKERLDLGPLLWDESAR